MQLEQRNILLPEFLAHFVRPDAGLYFTNMGLTQIKHAKPRLADPAADRLRQMAIEQPSMKQKLCALFTAPHGKLTSQRFGVNTNTP